MQRKELVHKKANKTHGLVMRRADGIHFVDKYQPLAAILSDFLGPQWLRLAAKKKKKMPDTEWPLRIASFIGRVIAQLVVWKITCGGKGYSEACTANEFHEMHAGNFTEICSFRKLCFQERKTLRPCRCNCFLLCDSNFQQDGCSKAVGT